MDTIDALDTLPSEEDVATGLHEVLAVHDTLGIRPLLCGADELGEHRWLGFFGLEEQRVVAVAAEQQQDPGAGAHASDADDFARDLCELEVLEQMSAIALQC